ncbi:MAG TPA: lytic transglycosylase domain-containing protein [Variovorax sp.]|nr:lytic transglycosylase domain-containing protein [Variovorax sp.]
MKTHTLLRSLILAAALSLAQHAARAADIYGYVDAQGVAHFAAERLDARYRLFFRGGQSFDTAQGLGPSAGRAADGGAGDGAVAPAARTLLALFEASPHHRAAKAALQLAARTHDIDYELLQALVATESGFDAQAVSPKGARGLMQLMPATAERYGVRGDARTTQELKLFDPRVNVAAGSRYLRDLIGRFQGSIELALAAYNAGEGAVQRAGNRIPDYRETQNYVKTVLQIYAYLKPGAGAATPAASGTTAVRGGRAPQRVRMELAGAAPASAPAPVATVRADRPTD